MERVLAWDLCRDGYLLICDVPIVPGAAVRVASVPDRPGGPVEWRPGVVTLVDDQDAGEDQGDRPDAGLVR